MDSQVTRDCQEAAEQMACLESPDSECLVRLVFPAPRAPPVCPVFAVWTACPVFQANPAPMVIPAFLVTLEGME